MQEITLELYDAAAWRAWLEKNHSNNVVVWLVLGKESSPKRGLTYQLALDEAICHGWIDSRTKGIDDLKHVVRFTQRRPGGRWSVTNLRKAQSLLEEHRVTPWGRATMPEDLDAALSEAEDRDASELEPPPELRVRLEEEGLLEQFLDMAPSLKRSFNMWVSQAKAGPTRDKRAAEAVHRLRQGELLEHMTKWKPK
ncbi:MAG: YdeI/OmpD-associated family protein [Methanomassiliicoccales archaeon]